MQRLNEEFVLSNQPRQRLARHGLFWLVWVLFFTVSYGFLPVNDLLQRGMVWPKAMLLGFERSGIDAVLFMPAHMFLAYNLLYWLLPTFLLTGRYGWAVPATALLVLVTTVISAMLTRFAVDPLRIYMGAQPSGNSFFFAIMAGMRGATTIGGFAAAIKLAKVWYLKQQAYQQIDREKLQGELQLLKSQIHPPFSV